MEPFTYQSRADEPVSHAVVAAVASVSDCRPAKSAAADSADVLPPLYEAIDPDALDALFRRSDGSDADGVTVDGSDVNAPDAGEPNADEPNADEPDADEPNDDALDATAPDATALDAEGQRRVAFSYHGFRVTVRSDGSVTVESE